ncbi:MAG TPA: hemin uptake protein HemP [Rhizomicrobium sp.]
MPDLRRLEPVPAPSRPATRRIDLRDLLKGEREAVILHDGQEYRLRITSNSKLILTK